MEETPENFLKAIKDIDADLIEIRADSLKECSNDNVHKLLSDLKKITEARIILTVRNGDEGGWFEGTEKEREKIILGSLHLADLVDIELKSDIRDKIVSTARVNNIDVIISYHDFEKTPSSKEIEDIITAEKKAGADYAKVAFKANSNQDVLELLRKIERMSKKVRVVAISMGEIGRISRIAAPVFGSSIAYASVGRKTAPGQLSVADTRKILEVLGVSK
jgi:3-dehydroquinate dehydratase-1